MGWLARALWTRLIRPLAEPEASETQWPQELLRETYLKESVLSAPGTAGGWKPPLPNRESSQAGPRHWLAHSCPFSAAKTQYRTCPSTKTLSPRLPLTAATSPNKAGPNRYRGLLGSVTTGLGCFLGKHCPQQPTSMWGGGVTMDGPQVALCPRESHLRHILLHAHPSSWPAWPLLPLPEPQKPLSQEPESVNRVQKPPMEPVWQP